MPHELTWEPKGVHARFFGTCTIADVVGALGRIGGDPRLDDLRYAVFDYLAVASHDVEESQIEEAAAHDVGIALTNPRLVFASVTRDPQIVAIWRHFRSASPSPERLALFATLDEARAWITEQTTNGTRS
jgi:hypothetical protein